MGAVLGAIEKKLERIKHVAYLNRLPSEKSDFPEGRNFEQDLEVLRRDGTLVLENFIPQNILDLINLDLKIKIEDQCDFKLPCLAQSKVVESKHSEIINNKFKYSNSKLNQMGLCFNKDEIKSYKQVVEEFKPSTLKIAMEDKLEHFNVWLNPYLLKLIESYMGVVPYLTEAYTRRNFASKYRVMNHNWHRDNNHEHNLLKAFIFFTDCDLTDGPHEFIIGTHKDLSLSGYEYFNDQDVDALYPPESKKRFVSNVKAGTVILEDTRGLHRAAIPTTGERDLGYAIFFPIPFWRPLKQTDYKISQEVFKQLSPEQQKYIPECGLR